MIPSKDIQFLTFEGGGGKGIVYSGAIKALEERIAGQAGKPLIDISKPLENRQIKGISGASAGAITAFALALGLNSSQLSNIIDSYYTEYISSDKINLSQFERFFEDPSPTEIRRVSSGISSVYSRIKKINEDKIVNIARTISYLPAFGPSFLSGVKNAIDNELINPYNISDIMLWKLFFNHASPNILRKTLVGKANYKAINILEYDQLQTDNLVILLEYFQSLYFGLGLFKSVYPMNFFKTLLWTSLLPKLNNDYRNLLKDINNISKLNFIDFFNITKVDLVLTGVNVTTHQPEYFSVYHTPHFPVADAVALSMSIPILFKPVFIEGQVNKNFAPDAIANTKYRGFWVDGGMLNNYPIHAFDGITAETYTTLPPSQFHRQESRFNRNLVGFRLIERLQSNKDINPDNITFGRYLGDLFSTLRQPSSEGQIRTRAEKEITIELPTDGIEVTDFAGPSIDKERLKKSRDGKAMNQIKEELINKAYTITKTKLA